MPTAIMVRSNRGKNLHKSMWGLEFERKSPYIFAYLFEFCYLCNAIMWLS